MTDTPQQTLKPTESQAQRISRIPRIELFDVLRGVALVAMIIYHFSWDLQEFNLIPTGTLHHIGWKIFARSIACSFLILVGISLYLAHGKKFNKQTFIKRIAMVTGAACLITITTYFATPDRYIFFGILHSIALSSVFALIFLRKPPWLSLIVAIAVIIIGINVRMSAFNSPWLYWLGLGEMRPSTNDFEPIFPWFGLVLLGVAGAQFMNHFGAFPKLAGYKFQSSISRVLKFLGQNSLITYLLHQPILYGLVFAVVSIFGLQVDQKQVFLDDCAANCKINASQSQCDKFCPCVVDGFEKNGDFQKILTGELSLSKDEKSQAVIQQCSVESAD